MKATEIRSVEATFNRVLSALRLIGDDSVMMELKKLQTLLQEVRHFHQCYTEVPEELTPEEAQEHRKVVLERLIRAILG
jgi:hypothetical protein